MKRKFQSMTILVVDDQVVMRKAIKDMLRHIGYRDIVLASGGDEGYEVIKERYEQKRAIQLLITDWGMSKGSGIELVYNIKQSPEYYLLPTIMIAEEMLHSKISLAVEYGADGYILKPFQMPLLDKTIDVTLEKYISPDPDQKKFFIAEKKYLTNNYLNAFPDFLELYKKNKSAKLGYRIASCLKGLGQEDRAEKVLLSYLNTEFMPLLREIQKILIHKEGFIDTEIEIIERMLKQEWNGKLKSSLYLRLYQLYFESKKDLKNGYNSLKKGSVLDPFNNEIKKYKEQLEDWFPFLNPRNDKFEKRKGIKYANDRRVELRGLKNRNRLKKHIEQLNFKLQYVPEYSPWIFDLGLSLIESFKIKEGIKELETAIKIDPSLYLYEDILEYIGRLKD